ncbi:hypothetical protein B7L88_gp097 [Rhizobium phage RHEph10]|uniref:hypothetical protein n=1 Tax=Rhizobium phage RHEph10 TaxID=1220717 RepID=UPI0002AB2F00|nr:hypothetical protein B7L88_gp097 [Rhizobium phage RHEph10]AGC36191.1 hypothetical protein RHEph10_gp148 [Rhizobium phage RHEph10]
MICSCLLSRFCDAASALYDALAKSRLIDHALRCKARFDRLHNRVVVDSILVFRRCFQQVERNKSAHVHRSMTLRRREFIFATIVKRDAFFRDFDILVERDFNVACAELLTSALEVDERAQHFFNVALELVDVASVRSELENMRAILECFHAERAVSLHAVLCKVCLHFARFEHLRDAVLCDDKRALRYEVERVCRLLCCKLYVVASRQRQCICVNNFSHDRFSLSC